MMDAYRVVHLTKNRIYPTYQLYARMNSRKTAPQDGLRLAALITLEWLCKRLGDDLPPELADLPRPEEYRETDSSCLKSIRINSGFVVDVLSLPERGVWTMQITEPDLGSDPGNPEQTRTAVPGRVFETNVAFHIVGKELHCGFCTLISDPESAAAQADVYRLSLVRKLAAHPDFGLWQVTPLTETETEISAADQLSRLKDVVSDDINRIPCVVFTKIPEQTVPVLPKPEEMLTLFRAELLPPVAPVKKDAVLPYDIAHFTKYAVTFGRIYVLDETLFDRFCSTFHLHGKPGDVFVLEPAIFGGKRRTFAYSPNKTRQEQTIQELKELIYQYPREKEVSFGPLSFLSAARENLLAATEGALREAASLNGKWEQELRHLKLAWKEELDQKDREIAGLKEQLDRQRVYAARLDSEKSDLLADREETHAGHLGDLAEKDAEIAFLKRKLGQPTAHAEIAAWVEATFPDRLYLHPRAVDLLKQKSAQSVDCGLICDALDFLATDHMDCRYRIIDEDEMNKRSSEKYGRPFEIKPTGTNTIEYTPGEYKIKYQMGGTDKARENPLKYHLRVGNHTETLLRIYFLYDDERKRLVVGSLPHHLTAITIK